ncbi:MAG: class I SAM-dependent methyltransferase [bacterium]|nr:class I SAM-dependent methyltransferase [bacterium]
MSNTGKIGYVDACQVCGQPELTKIFSLGHHAPVHAHLTADKLKEAEITYPLNFCRCSNCGLSQLDYIVDPKILFYSEYPYFTGMTGMLVRNFLEMRDTLMESHGVKAGDFVVDVGSNDGTLLLGFKAKGMKVLGIEPTNVALVANQNGVNTLQEFFTEETAKKIVAEHGQAKVVTATNMFAHVNDVSGLAKGIVTMLSDDGIFVSESQYLVDMLEKTALDTIYHEHLRYYSIKPLRTLLSMFGMSMVDAQRIEAAGGSIRVYAKKGQHPESERLKNLLAMEEKMGIYDKDAFQSLAPKVERIKHDLMEILLRCKRDGKRIVGIGAPGRSNTLLNFAHIDASILDYAVEKNGSPKIGLFTPGTHIPIVDEAILYTDQPDYGLLLSWHIGDELIKKLKERGFRGKFISPMPEPKIIE